MKELAYEQLTLFPADSPASHFPLPGSKEAVRTTVTSGRKCLELLKNCGPVGSLAKMLLESSIWRSTRCFLTWKVSTTPHRRLLFRLVPSTPRTGGKGARLWRTPTANDGINSSFPKSQENRDSLVGQLMRGMFPTPTASMAEHGGPNSRDSHGKPGLQMAAMMYPTPTTGAGLCGGTENYQRLKALEAAGEITEEERRNMARGNGGQLNPDWVEWLMGFPIGWTSL